MNFKNIISILVFVPLFVLSSQGQNKITGTFGAEPSIVKSNEFDGWSPHWRFSIGFQYMENKDSLMLPWLFSLGGSFNISPEIEKKNVLDIHQAEVSNARVQVIGGGVHAEFNLTRVLGYVNKNQTILSNKDTSFYMGLGVPVYFNRGDLKLIGNSNTVIEENKYKSFEAGLKIYFFNPKNKNVTCYLGGSREWQSLRGIEKTNQELLYNIHNHYSLYKIYIGCVVRFGLFSFK